MADGSDTTVIEAPQSALVTGLKEFAGAHGGAKAVIEYVGRRGARIVLVGTDGEWGDQFADSTKDAREACDTAGINIDNEWERELMELMRPTNDLWRSMSKRTLSR